MGKILMPPGEDNPAAYLIDAIHEPIVTEELFFRVQDILNRKANKRTAPKNKKLRLELPLRGIMQCSKCDGTLTGSASRSKTGDKHFYYHCNHYGKERFPATKINAELDSVLELFTFKKNPTELYNIVLNNYLNESGVSSKEEYQKAQKALELVNNRMEEFTTTFY